MQSNRVNSLDLIRGLAALLVMLGHLRSIFFVPFSELINPSAIDKAFYFITGYGHECVIIFFVLSGYFVGASFTKNYNNNQLANHTLKYLINRMTRLWVVLIPALLLTLFFDKLGSTLSTSPTIYSTTDYFSFIHPSNDRGILTFIGNLFFFQTTLVPTFGTNTPLWSLANEFWYYLLFPLLYIITTNSSTPFKTRILSSFIFFVIGIFLFQTNIGLLEGFLIWLIGYAAYLLHALKINRLIRIIGIATFIAFFLLIRMKPIAYQDYILGIFSGILIISIGDLPFKWLQNIANYLSRISYTLYLVHLPLIIFIKATFLSGVILSNKQFDSLIFVLLSAIILITSHFIYWLFERNTEIVKKYTYKKILRF